MLPNIKELSCHNTPLEEFVQRTIATAPSFEPGSAFRYQSIGVKPVQQSRLQGIVERVTDTPLHAFIAHEIFEPLGMAQTSLRMGDHPLTDFALYDVEAKAGDESCDRWDWNSQYWQDFGAPWGGLHSTAADLTAFLRVLLDSGTCEDKRLLEERTVVEMTTDQIAFPNSIRGEAGRTEIVQPGHTSESAFRSRRSVNQGLPGRLRGPTLIGT